MRYIILFQIPVQMNPEFLEKVRFEASSRRPSFRRTVADVDINSPCCFLLPDLTVSPSLWSFQAAQTWTVEFKVTKCVG